MTTVIRKGACALVTALAIVALSATTAQAQGIGGAQGGSDERHEGIGIGIKGGWLFPEFSTDSAEFDKRTGQQIGIFFGGNRPGLIGVMAEVNYGKKGGTTEGDQDFDFTFVSVPVVLRVNAGSRDLSGVSFYGIVGPQFDWLLKRELGDVDIEDDTEGFELSVVAGAGIEITRFIVEFRYIHGLRAVSKEFDVFDSDELKSKAYAILFGFRFN